MRYKKCAVEKSRKKYSFECLSVCLFHEKKKEKLRYIHRCTNLQKLILITIERDKYIFIKKSCGIGKG